MANNHAPLDERTVILVTHVPKCVGTSLRVAIQEALCLGETDIYQPDGIGGKGMLFNHPARFRYIVGHYPYGIHFLFRPGSPVWRAPKIHVATFRDPVDQMVSFFYYHRKLGVNSPHSSRELESGDIVGFYERKPLVANLQTRMYAGIGFAKMDLSKPASRKLALSLAVRNLRHNYHYYIHHSKLDESVRIFSQRIGRQLHLGVDPRTRVEGRPSVQSLDQSVSGRLAEIGRVDYHLHDSMAEVFRGYYGESQV